MPRAHTQLSESVRHKPTAEELAECEDFRLRMDAIMTNAEFADRAGMSRSYVSCVRTGRRRVPRGWMALLEAYEGQNSVAADKIRGVRMELHHARLETGRNRREKKRLRKLLDDEKERSAGLEDKIRGLKEALIVTRRRGVRSTVIGKFEGYRG